MDTRWLSDGRHGRERLRQTAFVLESLVPTRARLAVTAADARARRGCRRDLPRQHDRRDTHRLMNVRSTVAHVFRCAGRAAPGVRAHGGSAGGWAKPGAFSATRVRCAVTCDGTGQITLGVRFLPDVGIECTECPGSPYGARAASIRRDSLIARYSGNERRQARWPCAA